MATTSPEPKSKKAPRINRFAIGVNVLIQLVLVFFIIAGVNYIGFKHFKRWDFSRNQKYALTSQTKNLLASLKQPVKAVVAKNIPATAMPESGEAESLGARFLRRIVTALCCWSWC